MDIKVGQIATYQRTFSQEDFDRFAALSGDDNPIHVDPEFASRTRFGRTVAHGMLLYSSICCVLGTQLPGPGSVQIEQELMFPAPTGVGEEVTVHLEVLGVQPPVAELSTIVTLSGGEITCQGRMLVLLPGSESFPMEGKVARALWRADKSDSPPELHNGQTWEDAVPEERRPQSGRSQTRREPGFEDRRSRAGGSQTRREPGFEDRRSQAGGSVIRREPGFEERRSQAGGEPRVRENTALEHKGLTLGQTACMKRTFSKTDLEAYADLSGDTNPIFHDDGAGREAGFEGPVIPEGLLGALFSCLLGTRLPGRGTNWLKQKLTFPSPAYPGQEITACVEIVRLRPEKDLVNLRTVCTDPDGILVCEGEALVLIKDLEG